MSVRLDDVGHSEKNGKIEWLAGRRGGEDEQCLASFLLHQGFTIRKLLPRISTLSRTVAPVRNVS